jgi:hypothetical protein
VQSEMNMRARADVIRRRLRIVAAIVSLLAASRAMALATCATPWAEGNTFTLGEVVSYANKNYKDLQPHTAWVGTGWTPPSTPALWSYVEDCSTGTASIPVPPVTAPPAEPNPPSEHKGVLPNPWTVRGYAAKQIYQRCVPCGQ